MEEEGGLAIWATPGMVGSLAKPDLTDAVTSWRIKGVISAMYDLLGWYKSNCSLEG